MEFMFLTTVGRHLRNGLSDRMCRFSVSKNSLGNYSLRANSADRKCAGQSGSKIRSVIEGDLAPYSAPAIVGKRRFRHGLAWHFLRSMNAHYHLPLNSRPYIIHRHDRMRSLSPCPKLVKAER